ncbi:curli production assembly/transport protein CsgE [Dryocola sp. BD613]|uniref:curli production assembly/transport protein CsgE n=1 Tax=Dryocola sp. BD613 TaxID=3133272 RepID=UPI003F500011
MKLQPALLLATVLLCASGGARAIEVEIPGLLTDHTVTSVGHDFYRAFSDRWESNFTGNMAMNERPSARWGSWITITVDQDVVFQTFLFPIKRDFDRNVDIALAQTDEAIKRRQIDKALLGTGDLAHDEF